MEAQQPVLGMQVTLTQHQKLCRQFTFKRHAWLWLVYIGEAVWTAFALVGLSLAIAERFSRSFISPFDSDSTFLLWCIPAMALIVIGTEEYAYDRRVRNSLITQFWFYPTGVGAVMPNAFMPQSVWLPWGILAAVETKDAFFLELPDKGLYILSKAGQDPALIQAARTLLARSAVPIRKLYP